jgi:O-acetyl-ADP-ribose deacetylase (regulator of RNase III)
MKFTQGNLLDAQVETVVNAVNTVGVMGKGIALMFKEKYPENFRAYEAACKAGEVQVGKTLNLMNEAETRADHVDPALAAAGWADSAGVSDRASA